MENAPRKKVSVVITDLDNTLFDWYEQWYESFSAMLAVIVAKSGVERALLLSEIKAIHERHGTSEYAFLLEEIPSLKEKHPGGNIAEIYDDAIQAYRAGRAKSLKLYPGVMATLRTLRAAGVFIVGYTESMAFYTSYRVRKLALDGVLDVIYSPADHDLPEGLSKEQIRKYPAETYDFKFTTHRYTASGQLKPNPALLLKIIEDIGAAQDECIYVGDNIMKDIAMANDAGITSVHAKYGEAHQLDSYDLLRAVTHWPAAHVEKERQANAAPSFTLHKGFSEVLAYFDFETLTHEKITERVRIWERIIDTQKHFNELILKIRGLAVTVLGAILTAAAFAIKDNVALKYGDVQFNAALPLLAIGLITWLSFYIIDHFWYHRLLIGAVKAGLLAEQRLRGIFPEIELTKSISEASVITLKVGRFEIDVHSGNRLFGFYFTGALILVGAALYLILQQPFGVKSASSATVTNNAMSTTETKQGADLKAVKDIQPSIPTPDKTRKTN